MTGGRKKNGIPDRWLDYSAVGKRLHGTRFIAFKVPLKQALNRQLSPSDVFGHWDLLDALQKQNQELGLIIDLTFTSRYYRLTDVPQSLLCVKIFTAGHEVPNDETILSFKRSVQKFLRENQDNDKLIGVHCTHGLNRTGYLICRYLIDVDGMDPSEALQLFNSSRGHDMERENYLEDLQRGPRRSNDGMEELDQEPQRGQALHPPCLTSSDGRDERRTHSNDDWSQRSFPPRGPVHRPHHRLPSPYSPSRYRWTRPDILRSRYEPPENPRSRYDPPENLRPRYDPPENLRSRYDPSENLRSRYEPPENPRSRYDPPENLRSRYDPSENLRSRYEPPENPRSRYDPPENLRSRYDPSENLRSRYEPPENPRSRYDPPENLRSRYDPSENLRSRYNPPPPPPLPQYFPRWDHGEPEEFWEPKLSPRTQNGHRTIGYDH
ncbi:RNA/RNP complex-1-interacting phosphatase isoform X7 [Acanthochromis polyacanthus]|uniref:RNA/RNP complex-1-interacting phosphatase isoform X7 n=1 Tax=Acanthochromis polyacanthus TaxID=80966 RepID=UPI0022341CAC|nr:RNA/RNP complex-1-interacting phosphatase isoform X7 [Acanthochromis polyacanthus]